MTSVKLEELHADRFAEQIHSEFQVMLTVPVTLELIEVKERLKSPRQETFALLFHGPGQYFLPQGIYPLRHSSLGEMEIFLVPVGQDAQGFQYEAVFNRIV